MKFTFSCLKFIKRLHYVTTDNKLHNGTRFAKKYLSLQLKRRKISYIMTDMQVCFVYIERVYISLQRDGYVPIAVPVMVFNKRRNRFSEMKFLCFIPSRLRLKDLEFGLFGFIAVFLA